MNGAKIVFVHGVGDKVAESDLKRSIIDDLQPNHREKMDGLLTMAYWLHPRYGHSKGMASGLDIQQLDSVMSMLSLEAVSQINETYSAPTLSLHDEPAIQEMIREKPEFAAIVQALATGEAEASANIDIALPSQTTLSMKSSLQTEALSEIQVIPVDDEKKRAYLKGVLRYISGNSAQDLFDFCFDSKERERMTDILVKACGDYDDILLIGHSQGSMISYFTLLKEREKFINKQVTFVSLGSPLGFEEIKAVIAENASVPGDKYTSDTLPVPPSTICWYNIANMLDPIAGDKGLRNDYLANGHGVRAINLKFWEMASNPHFYRLYFLQKDTRAVVQTWCRHLGAGSPYMVVPSR